MDTSNASARISSILGCLGQALQESNQHRPLDSLETVIVKSCLMSLGVEADANFVAQPNTIAGWLEWVKQSSRTP